MTDIEQRIIDKINREIGSDVKNLHKSKYLIKNFQQDLSDIEGKLCTENFKVHSSIKRSINNSAAVSKKLRQQTEKVNEFDERLTEKLESFSDLLQNVSDILGKIENLDHLVEYLKILRDIQELNHELTSCVNGKDETKIVGLYLSLCGEYESTNSVVGRLRNVDAPHLKSFASRTATYWHDILRDKFSKDFDALLKTIKWPYLGHSSEVLNPSKDAMNKLTILAEYLFLIKPPGHPSTAYIVISPSVLCPPISNTVQLLLKPFRQRFQFHFYGTKQTNRLDKPEWYFTQILSWAKDNHIFVGQNFQSAALRAGLAEHNVRLEFVRGLVQLAIEKLCVDIEEINRDEHLFAHLLDEVLSFEQELRETLSYPSVFPSAITVLTQPQYIVKWLAIEERFTTDKMDAMLTKGSPWEFLDPSNVEELKIPRCADQFLHLLDAIKERYRFLPQPGHQLQFLQLQLELIDNFRRRLVQLHTTNTSDSVSTTKILNAINYLTSVLREWGENVHYLHLHAALLGPNATEINSVFDKSVDELEHWQIKLLKELASKIVDDIKAKSMPYRHDIWVSMSEQNSKEPYILSVTAGEMFQVMVTSLHNLECELSTNIFAITLRLIAQHLDEFFIYSMIMNTKFSTGGAAQFQFDMQRNLFPLFGQYARKPEMLFKSVNDACNILKLPRGSALLLHQALKDDADKDGHLFALKEVKVSTLSRSLALVILERRTDICI